MLECTLDADGAAQSHEAWALGVRLETQLVALIPEIDFTLAGNRLFGGVHDEQRRYETSLPHSPADDRAVDWRILIPAQQQLSRVGEIEIGEKKAQRAQPPFQHDDGELTVSRCRHLGDRVPR